MAFVLFGTDNGNVTWDVQELPEFVDTYCETDDEPMVRINRNKEFSCSLKFNKRQFKFMLKLLYGWKSNGPIRIKLLNRLYDVRRRVQVC